MSHLRNRKNGIITTGRLNLIIAWTCLLSIIVPGIAVCETLDSTHYDQFVRFKRVMADIELWQGKAPPAYVHLTKDLIKSWTACNRQRTIELLHQTKKLIDKHQPLTLSGTIALDSLQHLDEISTITLLNDRMELNPVFREITLETGIVKLYRIHIINESIQVGTATISSPDLFRVSRQISVSPGDISTIVCPVRTLESIPFQTDIIVSNGTTEYACTFSVNPQPNNRRPLVGIFQDVPGYGRFNRIRLGGEGKPDPKEVDKHPERFRPTHYQEVTPGQQEEVRIRYLSLRSHPSTIYRLPGDWDYLELDRDKYSWNLFDANIQDIKHLMKSMPVMFLGYEPWWIKIIRNPNGKKGLKDPANKDLVGKYRQYIREVARHTHNDIKWFELWNEPSIYWFYDPTNLPIGPQYVTECSRMLKTAISISVDELRQETPDCFIISNSFAGLPDFPQEWSMIKNLMDQGVLDQVDALCIHEYPLGCGAKPPPGKSYLPWIELNYITDETPLLHELQQRDKGNMPLWSSELGGLGNDRLDGLAYLQMGSILAHQGFCGLHFTTQPVALHLLAEAVTGAQPVEWGPCRKMNSYYSGLVLKTFTRGPEDIVIIWNNSDQGKQFKFVPSDPQNPQNLLLVQELAEPLGGPAYRNLYHTEEELNEFFRRSFQIGPLGWKAFLIIPNGNTGFQWLSGIDGIGPDPKFVELEQLWHEMRTFQRDIQSGDIGSPRDRKAFKGNFTAFRKAFEAGDVRNATSSLEDLVNLGKKLSR